MSPFFPSLGSTIFHCMYMLQAYPLTTGRSLDGFQLLTVVEMLLKDGVQEAPKIHFQFPANCWVLQ